MRHYKPRQIEGTDPPLYHYTVGHDGVIFPIGLCAEDCPGHPTEAEAVLHASEYLQGMVEPKFERLDVRLCDLCKVKPAVWAARVPGFGGSGLVGLCEGCKSDGAASLRALTEAPVEAFVS